jgi:hypothetical protein
MEKKELLQAKFGEIIAEALVAGYERGVQVFTEGIEEDLAMQEMFESGIEVEDVVDRLMEDAGYTAE